MLVYDNYRSTLRHQKKRMYKLYEMNPNVGKSCIFIFSNQWDHIIYSLYTMLKRTFILNIKRRSTDMLLIQEYPLNGFYITWLF